MSLAKVNLLNELDALALYPFRLFVRRKNDHYQLATGEYVSKLNQLCRQQAEKRLGRLSGQRRRCVSPVLRLDGNSQSAESLTGITIARSNFPSGRENESIVLTDANGGQVIVRGTILAVTEDEIKIKLHKPIVLSEEVEVEPETRAEPASSLSVELAQAGASNGCGDDDDGSSCNDANTKDSDKEEEEEDEQNMAQAEVSGGVATNGVVEDSKAEKKTVKRVIDFKIEYCEPLRGFIDANRMLIEEALGRFERLKCDPAIHKNLLGFYDGRSDFLHEKARVVMFDELIKLKGQQKLAVEQAIKRRVSLIEGPAGSGKTLVAAYIAANMSRLKRARVLLCSPIQANVDRLAELVDRVNGIRVVRMPDGPVKLTLDEVLGQSKQQRQANGASSYLEAGTQASRCYLDKLVDDEIYLQAWNRSKDTLSKHQDSLHSHAYRMVTSCSQHRRRDIEAKILARSDVVCCTNKSASSHQLNGVTFDILILDDAQVASEIDCLIPMMAKGIKQVVLLSDRRKRIRLARSLRQVSAAAQTNGRATPAEQPAPADQQIERAAPAASQPKQQVTRSDTRSSHGSLRRKSYRKSRGQATISQANGGTANRPSGSSRASSSSAIGANHPEPVNSKPTLEPGGLFERLLAIGLPTVDLRLQFRLHETLSNFTNHHYYLGRLKNDQETNAKLASEIEKRLLMGDEKRFDWLPNRNYLTAMFSLESQTDELLASSSTDQMSPEERRSEQSLKSIVAKLNHVTNKLTLAENIQESRIGIIFNRRPMGQRSHFVKKIPANIKTGTVADFVGQERDFVILVVLPDQCGGQAEAEPDDSDLAQVGLCAEIKCDFKLDDGALNCALTRARLGLFLIGADYATMTSGGDDTAESTGAKALPKDTAQPADCCRGWHDLVQYYKASRLLVV